MKAITIVILSFFILIGCREKPTSRRLAPVPALAEDAPAWSNAGDKIAFFSVFDSLGVPSSGIYITDTLGNSRRPTGVFGAAAKWLPGDSELVVSTGFAGPGGFLIYNLNSGATRSLGVSSSSPPFDVSRDGQFIYYLGPAIDTLWTTGIYRFRMSDNSVLAIVDGQGPAISSDGSTLAYERGGLCTRIVGDSAESCLSLIGRNQIWSGDGKSIIYDNEKGAIHVTDLVGNDKFLVSGGGGIGLSLSPDGLSILFTRASGDFQIHIWRINIDGTGLRQVTR